MSTLRPNSLPESCTRGVGHLGGAAGGPLGCACRRERRGSGARGRRRGGASAVGGRCGRQRAGRCRHAGVALGHVSIASPSSCPCCSRRAPTRMRQAGSESHRFCRRAANGDAATMRVSLAGGAEIARATARRRDAADGSRTHRQRRRRPVAARAWRRPERDRRVSRTRLR